jgi:SAM-dependent methyltransferase
MRSRGGQVSGERTKATARYYPEIFDTADIPRAKAIILTEEGPGADTETRWAQETPYVMELVQRAFGLGPDMLVLDYGCGIGRMAQAMIAASGCTVIGLDISARMRAMANEYVASDRFLAVTAEQFDTLVGAGLRVHAAIAVWVLQHCLAPAEDLARMRRGLVAGGRGFVLNMPKRAVPAVRSEADAGTRFLWASDDVDVAALVRAAFQVEAEGTPEPSRTPNMAEVGAYWMSFRQRGR